MWVVACRIILSAPVPFPFLWTSGFGTWIWDLDLGPRFGIWISDLDLVLDLGLTINVLILDLSWRQQESFNLDNSFKIPTGALSKTLSLEYSENFKD